MGESVIVADLGTMYTRIGFAQGERPNFVTRTDELISGEHTGGRALTRQLSNIYSHIPSCERLALPAVRRGRIKDFKVLETTLAKFSAFLGQPDHSFDRIFLTVPVKSSLSYLTQLAEEALAQGFRAVAFGVQPRLGLFSTGATTGVCLDLGHGLSQISCLVEHSVLSHAENAMELAGYDVNLALKRSLSHSGVLLGPEYEEEYLRVIKESFCACAEQPDDIAQQRPEVAAVLPDGQELLLAQEKYLATERLFTVGGGIQSLTMQALASCGAELRAALLQNIVCCGGTSLLPGLGQRLGRVLSANWGEKVPFTIQTYSRSAPHASWIGASAIAASDHARPLFIGRNELEESGEQLILRNFV